MYFVVILNVYFRIRILVAFPFKNHGETLLQSLKKPKHSHNLKILQQKSKYKHLTKIKIAFAYRLESKSRIDAMI